MVQTPTVFAWGNHEALTRICIKNNGFSTQVVRGEPLSRVLKTLGFRNLKDFSEKLALNQSKIPKREFEMIKVSELLVIASMEPDQGMDQELNISPDQPYMGGLHGLSSQGFRHLFYPAFDWRRPRESFHFPMRKMGEAPKRAQVFFDLAKTAYQKKHFFWAYRFLGWGLHYVQDLTQPYHVSQFGSFELLALGKIAKSWTAVIEETTRLVSNFHLSFEEYVDQNLKSNKEWTQKLTEKTDFEESMEGSVQSNLEKLSVRFVKPLKGIITAQSNWVGKELFQSDLNLGSGMKNSKGEYKITFLKERLPNELNQELESALSNAGGACRWYIQKLLTTLR